MTTWPTSPLRILRFSSTDMAIAGRIAPLKISANWPEGPKTAAPVPINKDLRNLYKQLTISGTPTISNNGNNRRNDQSVIATKLLKWHYFDLYLNVVIGRLAFLGTWQPVRRTTCSSIHKSRGHPLTFPSPLSISKRVQSSNLAGRLAGVVSAEIPLRHHSSEDDARGRPESNCYKCQSINSAQRRRNNIGRLPVPSFVRDTDEKSFYLGRCLYGWTYLLFPTFRSTLKRILVSLYFSVCTWVLHFHPRDYLHFSTLCVPDYCLCAVCVDGYELCIEEVAKNG